MICDPFDFGGISEAVGAVLLYDRVLLGYNYVTGQIDVCGSMDYYLVTHLSFFSIIIPS